METNAPEDPIDQLLVKRLSRLGSKPIDTTDLDRVIRAQIPAPKSSWQRMLRPLAAVAASLILITIVGVIFFSSRNVLASSSDMAQMHRDIVSGKIATMKVDSMEQANEAIAAFAGNFPQLAEPPKAQAMACCMRNVGNKKIACVLLSNADAPVTVVVANTDDVKTPPVSATAHNGQSYYVQTFGNLNMVMSERQHHWICLVGELPSEKLMDLSGGLKFSAAR